MSAVKPKAVQRAKSWDDSVEEGTVDRVELAGVLFQRSKFFCAAYRFQIAGYKDLNEYVEKNPSVEVSKERVVHRATCITQ